MHDELGRFFTPDELALLTGVLNETMRTIVERVCPEPVDAESHAIASRVGRLLIDLYRAGLTDPEALREAVLQSLNLSHGS
jgi:hypothetical protein